VKVKKDEMTSTEQKIYKKFSDEIEHFLLKTNYIEKLKI